MVGLEKAEMLLGVSNNTVWHVEVELWRDRQYLRKRRKCQCLNIVFLCGVQVYRKKAGKVKVCTRTKNHEKESNVYAKNLELDKVAR